MRNVLKRMWKQFSDFFLFNILNLSFWDFFSSNKLEDKFSFAPIYFKLRSVYVSEDYT